MHLSSKEVINIIGQEKWNSAETFSVIRNPWDKVVSHYLYRVSTNQTSLRDQHLPFTEWVKRTYGQNKDPFYYDKPKMFQTQSDWLNNDDGELAVKHLLRFENLCEDFKAFAPKINCSSELPHLNKTQNIDYRSLYNDEASDIVAQWFKEDINRFNFSF